jgi:putative endonuclease
LPQHQIVEHHYYVYILASKSRTLYIGVTNNLRARILQHRSGEIGGFTSDYKIHRLVYYEQHAWIQNAIAREKQLKRWRREKKVWLIERENPTWEDLAADWGKAVKLTRTKSCQYGQQVPPLTR